MGGWVQPSDVTLNLAFVTWKYLKVTLAFDRMQNIWGQLKSTGLFKNNNNNNKKKAMKHFGYATNSNELLSSV